LRRFALILCLCTVALFATFAHAQQLDIAGGAGEMYSTSNTNASLAYLPPAEKGGIYPSVSLVRLFNNRFGYSAELSTVYKRQFYNGFQAYRPILYDVNAVFAPHLALKRASANFMAGIGGQTVLFYNQYANCNFAEGCVPRVNGTNFLLHLGAGLHYTVWRNFFVRPEANFYRVIDNSNFHSGNVLRLGASFGYTFHIE